MTTSSTKVNLCYHNSRLNGSIKSWYVVMYGVRVVDLLTRQMTSSTFNRRFAVQPTNADIRRKNANFAARAQAGKRTARPPKSAQRRSVATWVLIVIGFLLVGGSKLIAIEEKLR